MTTWIAPDEAQVREAMVAYGHSLFERGLAPDRIKRFDAEGGHVSGAPASREAVLHRALYAEWPGTSAIVHLHATHSAAVSCMAGLDAHSTLAGLGWLAASC